MEDEQGKQKIVSYSTSSPSTKYRRYLGSENSSTNSYGEKNKIPRYQNDFGKDGRFDSKQVPLSAFVLHPLGTHYVPVTIPPTHFKSVFKDDTKGPTAYHPISIPLNFCGPSVSIHAQVEQQLLCASEGQKEERCIENSKIIFDFEKRKICSAYLVVGIEIPHTFEDFRKVLQLELAFCQLK
ncbi:unnamed protein product [Mytilus coruscus]|uniref:Uncharacterized protein n=1 Tax=Mytilus coruscus TaxID=42192 RepID=A0A6J8AVM3_MYTCO|nr:unnamed protein product [Mytilus coruscus]